MMGDKKRLPAWISKNNLLKLIFFSSAALLSIEKFLLSNGSLGLCKTQGCQVVGEYVRFGEPFLIFVGAVFFWGMWLLAFFADRYPKEVLYHFLRIGLLGAMAFDGALLGYQFMGIKTFCLLCLGVGISLAASALCLAWARQTWIFALVCLVVWTGGFLGNAVLKFRVQLPGYKEITLVDRPAERQLASLNLYLIFSLHCGHCSELVFNLAINRPWAASWHLATIDDKKEDLQRLSAWIEDPGLKKNPFLALVKVEADEIRLPGGKVLSRVKKRVEKAKDFFLGRGYRAVPMLIAQEAPGREIVLTGEDAISEYLWEKGLISHWIDFNRLEKK